MPNVTEFDGHTILILYWQTPKEKTATKLDTHYVIELLERNRRNRKRSWKKKKGA